jgi:putative membrane protein
MNISDLPTLNAILNSISAIFLILGYRYIKKGEQQSHKKFMISALVVSALFLTSYVIYHYNIPSTPYPYHDWTRPVYFAILIPHIILAAIMGPFILSAVIFAFKGKFETHKKIVKWIWPVWMFVSVSGVIIYLMLYKL